MYIHQAIGADLTSTLVIENDVSCLPVFEAVLSSTKKKL